MTGVRYSRILWIGAAGTLVLAAPIGTRRCFAALLRTDWQILLTLFALVVSAGTAVAG